MEAQCHDSSMVFSNSDSYSKLEYKTCGKVAQLEDLVDGLDPLQEGEENGCKSQSSPIQTQLYIWDGHNPDNSRLMAESQVQGLSSDSMDTSDGLDLDQNQDSSEDKYNSNDHGQCSYFNKQHPFEMKVLKRGCDCVVVEKEQHLGIVEKGLQVKKEKIDEENFMNDESSPNDSSKRFTIEQENIKEGNEKGMKEEESDGGYHSHPKMMQIQDISPVKDTAIIGNFKNENNSIALNEQDMKAEGIGEQGSSTPNKCVVNNSPDQLLLTHNRHVHSSKSYTCEYCGYMSNNKSNLTRHLRTHTGERPYSCEFCDKSYTQKSNLSTHLHTHTGERPYSCEFCGKAFTQKSNLTKHILTHTGERSHNCEFCDKTFTSKSYLTGHLRTHTGERPYNCEFCDETFTLKQSLTRHLLTHTGERPYSCEFCDKSYTQKSNLSTHVRRLHPEYSLIP